MFGFIGEISKALFGTLTDSDLDAIKSQLNTFSKNQQKIVHVMEHSLTVINASQIQIRENRETINHVIDSLGELDSKLINITKEISGDLYATQSFLYNYNQLDIGLRELERDILQGHLLLEHLRTKFSFLSLTKLSVEVISPYELLSVLTDIQNRLPSSYKLPLEPREEGLWDYYENLQLSAYHENSQIVVIIPIPLLRYGETYDVYKILNLLMPLPNVSMPTEQSTALVAFYDLPIAGMIINKMRTRYSLLTAQEVSICENAGLKICGLEKPTYPINLSHECLTKLFLEGEGGDNCHPVVRPNEVNITKSYPPARWCMANLNHYKFTVCRDMP